MTPPSRAAGLIRIRCPVSPQIWRDVAGGDLAALERDPAAGAMIAVIRADNPLGDFGLYRGVFEVSLGAEGFTPNVEARPTAGAAGTDILLANVTITTYVDADADPDAVEAAIAALVAAHPWEGPVIEIWDQGLRLAVRSLPP